MYCQLPCIAKHVLYSCLRTLKYRTLAHLSFTNTIQTLRILKPLCHAAPGTAAATRPCSQITLGRLVMILHLRFANPKGACAKLHSRTLVGFSWRRKKVQKEEGDDDIYHVSRQSTIKLLTVHWLALVNVDLGQMCSMLVISYWAFIYFVLHSKLNRSHGIHLWLLTSVAQNCRTTKPPITHLNKLKLSLLNVVW